MDPALDSDFQKGVLTRLEFALAKALAEFIFCTEECWARCLALLFYLSGFFAKTF